MCRFTESSYCFVCCYWLSTNIYNMSCQRSKKQNNWMFNTFSSFCCVCVFSTQSAQPMHWIYNPDKLKEVLSDLEPSPEFRPQSANPFYSRTTGEQTCYGDQAYILLESLSQCGGTEDPPDTAAMGHMLKFSQRLLRLSLWCTIREEPGQDCSTCVEWLFSEDTLCRQVSMWKTWPAAPTSSLAQGQYTTCLSMIRTGRKEVTFNQL